MSIPSPNQTLETNRRLASPLRSGAGVPEWVVPTLRSTATEDGSAGVPVGRVCPAVAGLGPLSRQYVQTWNKRTLKQTD